MHCFKQNSSNCNRSWTFGTSRAKKTHCKKG
uniref:Uncharacterized protein n=1 Tax=Arundo donax TaxID=35708 RepID=A0A0A9DKX5_ARUDO